MFKRGKEEQEFVYFGEQRVEIPKLTVGKWKLLTENIESLPQILINVLSAKGSDNFTASLVIGVSLAIEEIVTLVAVITELEEEFIYNNADHNDLMNFISKTVKKNNLTEAAKKFQAVLAKANKAVENSAVMQP